MSALTAFDTHGKPFVRALLRDNPTVETVACVQLLLDTGKAGYSVYDVAAEIGVRLPVIAASAPVFDATTRDSVRPKSRIKSHFDAVLAF